MCLLAAACRVCCRPPAMADVVLSSNDGHTIMDAQKSQVAPNPVGPDTITVIDVKSYPPKIKAHVRGARQRRRPARRHLDQQG